MDDRVSLQRRRDTFKKTMQQLTSQYEGMKAQLNEHETFVQVNCFTGIVDNRCMFTLIGLNCSVISTGHIDSFYL